MEGARASRRAVAVLGAAVVALAGAFGGGDELSKAEYQKELDSATQKVEQAFKGLGESLQKVGSGSGSLDAVAGEVANIQDELNSAADDLDGITPPENVEATHENFVEGMRALSDDLEEFKDAIEQGDTGAIDEFAKNADSLDSVQELEDASNELKQKGYKVGSD